MSRSPYACEWALKNLSEITDDEFADCPGTGCSQCEWCIDDLDYDPNDLT